MLYEKTDLDSVLVDEFYFLVLFFIGKTEKLLYEWLKPEKKGQIHTWSTYAKFNLKIKNIPVHSTILKF